MGINWKVFLTNNFWFSVDRAGLHRADYVILYFGIALAGLGILLALYKRFAKNEFLKKIAGRISTIFFTIGLAEVVWFIFRNEYAKALGTKFAAAIVVLIGLVWLYFPIKYLVTRYKTDMAEAQRKVQREKYLSM